MDTLNCVVVGIDGTISKMDVDDDIRAFQNIVGGFVEPLYIPEHNLVLLVNDEGLINGSSVSCVIRNENYGIKKLFGPVIILGYSMDKDVFFSVPENILDILDSFLRPVNYPD